MRVRCLEDLVARAGQDPPRRATHRRLVLHEEDHRAGPDRGRQLARRLRLLRRDLDRGQQDPNARAAIDLGVDRHATAGLLHDPVDGGEPESGALAFRLRREERIEGPVGDLLRHPVPGVGHDQQEVSTWRELGVLRGRFVVVLDVLRFDDEPATTGHRVPRVDDEVERDLLDLPAIGDDGPDLGRYAELEGDALGQRAPEHRPQLPEELVEPKLRRLNRAAPGEGEQLTGERRSALRGPLDLREVIGARIAGRQPFGQKIGVVGDDREDVVEVVGHPAGEPAETLEPLGLMQPCLEVGTAPLGLDTLGLVANDRGDPAGDAGGVADRRRGDRDVDERAVLPLAHRVQHRDDDGALGRRHEAGDLRLPLGHLLWRDQDRRRLADHLGPRIAEHPRRRRVPVGDDPVGRGADHRVDR